jgi:hypothetical protein
VYFYSKGHERIHRIMYFLTVLNSTLDHWYSTWDIRTRGRTRRHKSGSSKASYINQKGTQKHFEPWTNIPWTLALTNICPIIQVLSCEKQTQSSHWQVRSTSITNKIFIHIILFRKPLCPITDFIWYYYLIQYKNNGSFVGIIIFVKSYVYCLKSVYRTETCHNKKNIFK